MKKATGIPLKTLYYIIAFALLFLLIFYIVMQIKLANVNIWDFLFR